MNEIERLSNLIAERKAEYIQTHGNSLYELIPLDLDFLTSEEKEEFHKAKLALPSQGQLMKEARERLLKRVMDRNSKKSNPP
jgi:hypothetical protein